MNLYVDDVIKMNDFSCLGDEDEEQAGHEAAAHRWAALGRDGGEASGGAGPGRRQHLQHAHHLQAPHHFDGRVSHEVGRENPFTTKFYLFLIFYIYINTDFHFHWYF